MAISRGTTKKKIDEAKSKFEDYSKDLQKRHQNGINAATKNFENNVNTGNYWRTARPTGYTSNYAGSSTMGQPKGGAKYGSQVGIAGGANKSSSSAPDYTDLRNIAKPEYTDPRTLERPEFEQGTAFNPNADKTNVNKWRDSLEDMYNQIVNRGPFEYNQNEDPLYQQYEDMYTRNAKLAMQDTVGQVAALTGGYGSSYAETAGQAMYNQAMNGLNERAIELYGLAQDRYNQETNRLQQNFANAGNMYNQAYGEMRDDMSDQRYAYELAEEQRRERNANALQMYDYDRQDLAALNDYNLQMYNYDLQNAAAMNDYNLNLWDANNRNNQWAQEFLYQQQQDSWNNQFKQDQFEYQKQQDEWNNQFQMNKFNRSNYESDRDNDYKYDVLDYDAEEAEKNRLYNSAEAEKDRIYNSTEAEKNRLYNSAEAEKDRIYNSTEANKTREYNSKQNQLDREHEMNKLNRTIEADGYESGYKQLKKLQDGNTTKSKAFIKDENFMSPEEFAKYPPGMSVNGHNAQTWDEYMAYKIDGTKGLSEAEKTYLMYYYGINI